MAAAFETAALTGASGLVGSRLARLLLEQGVRLRLLVHREPVGLLAEHSGVQIFRGDVTDRAVVEELLDSADVAFHIAALVTPWVREPRLQHEINVEGTRHMIDVCEAKGLPLVCTSSVIVLDSFPPPVVVRLLDGNHYVKSKRKALGLIREARARGAWVSSVLSGGVVGPGDRRTGIGRLIAGLADGAILQPVFNGGIYLVDVRDVATAHINALSHRPADYVLPGEYWALDRLFTTVGEKANRRVRLMRVPWPAALAAATTLSAWARVVSRRAPLLTPVWTFYFAHAPTYENDAARLNICPRPIADSLAETVSALRDGAHDR